MPQTSEGNVHGLQYREAKPSQGNPSQPVSELFRLDNRTIISKILIAIFAVFFDFYFTDNKATVTGASGFLGTTLAIAIFESGADIVCLDISSTPSAANWGESSRFCVNLNSRGTDFWNS
jgi:hypothetical protein